MKEIAIYGAGGLGHEVAAAIRNQSVYNSEDWKIIGYFDDRDFSHAEEDHLLGKWLGGLDTLNSWPTPIGVILSFGEPQSRQSISQKITNSLVDFPNCINKDFRITDLDSFSIGKGNLIQGNCVVTTNISIGDFNLLNGSVTLGHDVKINNANVFMPGCRISGNVKINEGNMIGAMAFVKQGIKIGEGVRLSPLSALLTKPKNHSTYIGNPAIIFKF